MPVTSQLNTTCHSVAAKSDKNLMTISNLGVCFGPTLLRPEEDSMAGILEIKFGNVVVEMLIEYWDKVRLVHPIVIAAINIPPRYSTPNHQPMGRWFS